MVNTWDREVFHKYKGLNVSTIYKTEINFENQYSLYKGKCTQISHYSKQISKVIGPS